MTPSYMDYTYIYQLQLDKNSESWWHRHRWIYKNLGSIDTEISISWDTKLAVHMYDKDFSLFFMCKYLKNLLHLGHWLWHIVKLDCCKWQLHCWPKDYARVLAKYICRVPIDSVMLTNWHKPQSGNTKWQLTLPQQCSHLAVCTSRSW